LLPRGRRNVGTKSTPWVPVWLVLAGMLIAVCTVWSAATDATLPASADAQLPLTPQAYLPFVARVTCPGKAVVNGGFEQGEKAWHQYTTGTHSKAKEDV
jgi:hypothetical protein